MTDYETRRTNVPPVLAIEDGRLVIKLIDGPLTLIAEVGDGKFFLHQVIEKLVDPALALAAQVMTAQVRDAKVLYAYPMGTSVGMAPPEATPVHLRYVPYASPND